MQAQARDTRHTVLLFLIVVTIPLIFHPSDLGLKLNIPIALYILGELLYSALVATVFLDFPRARIVAAASAVCLGFRLCAGIGFAILLFLMNGVAAGTAFGDGLWSYKPALLLQTLTAPFILLSVFRSIFGIGSSRRAGKLSITPLWEVKREEPVQPEIVNRSNPQKPVAGRRHTEPGAPEPSAHDFNAALQHVFELSAVKFCVLFDGEGLPVGFTGDDMTLRDNWAPIGCLLSQRIQSGLARVGDLVLEGFNLTLDKYRLHMISVCEMWLLVGADRNSEELEKVRIGQAVEMIRRIYHQKYVDLQPTKVAEESHV